MTPSGVRSLSMTTRAVVPLPLCPTPTRSPHSSASKAKRRAPLAAEWTVGRRFEWAVAIQTGLQSETIVRGMKGKG